MPYKIKKEVSAIYTDGIEKCGKDNFLNLP